jgi:hypothetical protein
LTGVLGGLQGIGAAALSEIGSEAERECTISTAIRGSAQIRHDITSA